MGELSMDAGGMTREWMDSLIKILQSESEGLFVRCDTPQIAYNLSPYSSNIPEWEAKFVMLGKIIGKALFERIPLNLCFARTIYKAILEENIDLGDIAFLDRSVRKGR